MPIYDKDGNPLTAIYDVNGNVLVKAYDKDGDVIFNGQTDYDNYVVSQYSNISNLNTMQGFAIYEGIIFQFRANSSSNNLLCTINASLNSIIQNGIATNSDHGDSASFSTEKYSESDVYPLLYVTADTNPAKVYVNRVTLNSSALINTYLFPLINTGYYAAHIYDEQNAVMYMIGYTENSYLSDNGGSNKMLVSKWDMTQITDNGDGTLTPVFISSFTRPFIHCTQGQQWHDGMLWVSAGYPNHPAYVYALDANTGEALHIIDLNTTVEIEGLDFISNNEMVVGLQGGRYLKYTFAIN